MVNMTRTTGRAASENQTYSRKNPVSKHTEKGSSVILNYDIKIDSVLGKPKVTKFGTLVGRDEHHIGPFKPKDQFCLIPSHEVGEPAKGYPHLGHAVK